MNDDRLNLWVGTGVLLALVAGVALVLALEGKHLRSGIVVHVTMDRSGPLQEGDELRVAGRAIGTIDTIRMTREGVILDVWIERDSAWMVRQNSDIFLNQAGILGEPYLEAAARIGEEPGPPVEDGLTVRGIDPPRMDRLMQKSYQNLVAVTDLFRNGMPEARALGRELSRLGAEIDAIEEEAGTDGLMGARLRRLYEEGVAAVTFAQAGDVDELGDVLDRAEATLARARADVRLLRARIAALQARLDRIVPATASARIDQLREILASGDALAAQVDALVAKAQSLAAMVRRGEGSLAAIASDIEFADELKAMTKMLKSQPWKFMGNRKNRDAKDPIIP